MTSPAEKIRQVVEEMEQEIQTKIPAARGRILEEKQLMDSLILSGYEAATEKWLKCLKEARSSLDGGCTSIANSTHAE